MDRADHRTGVQDLRRFIRAVVRADESGVSIADVPDRGPGDAARAGSARRGEGDADPVTVIFPLMLFILPTLFIVLLGPAVVDVLAAFG